MLRRLSLVALLASAAPAVWAQAKAPIAVLLLAHGGSAKWDAQITQVKKAVEKAGYPVEIALGMADPANIEKALAKLSAKRPSKVVCVPILISSNSELYEQFAYVLGLREQPSADFLEGMRQAAKLGQGEERSAGFGKKGRDKGHDHRHHTSLDARQVKTKLDLKLASALDDHPYVAQILLARARAVSKNPAKEIVAIVSHGPYTDAMEGPWMETADKAARQLAQLGGFAEAKAFNMRDDAPIPVRQAKAKELRAYCQQRSKEGKQIIIVPHLVSMNGIEKHITKALDGLFYKISREALLPHPLVEQWVLAQIKSHE
ncbi:MAG: hypothetical protein HYT79_02985 [Elusimicrobia bacterium]|nr:hypothetical protein [Elusimicrobiota bacterium]